MADLGKLLVVFGALIVVAGLVLMLVGRIPFLGRLPGDFSVQRGNWTFYFPLATSILISVILSVLLYLVGRR